MIFHTNIADRKLDQYKEEWDSLNDQRILNEQILNAYRLAKAIQHQYVFVRISLAFLMSGFGVLVILLITSAYSMILQMTRP
jgi:hypothetical protein